MRKRVVILAVAVLIVGAISGFVFANSRIDFDAELHFESATDDSVVLSVTNRGKSDLVISKNANYIDEFGSPGSWKATSIEDTVIGPGQCKYIHYHLEEAVAHGDNSILAFFFLHDDYWYLAKVGVNYGLEIYTDHD